MSSSYLDRERQFEEYLRDGITAAKSGQRKLAVSLLNRAIYLNNGDARPYIWLSATTDNPQEQIEYLERAVAIDPTNVAARRGLALLTGKIDRSQMMPEGQGIGRAQEGAEIEVDGRSFACPRCGGRMAYQIAVKSLVCEYCGYQESAPEQPAQALPAEQMLDFVIPTTRGHRWTQAQQRLTCERCGAQQVLPPGHKTAECSYCGSNHLVASAEQEELIDPQVIALMQVDRQQAYKLAHRWLGSGLLAPDNLFHAANRLQLRPGYYSCWLFNGMVELHWTCEVVEGDGRFKHWTAASGTESRFFDDVLVAGVRAISDRELQAVGPFRLDELKDFSPECLAGWPTILYDRSLSDASLAAREQVLRQLRPATYQEILAGQEKRNLNIGSSDWGGITFKHVLIPLWIGDYTFQGRSYHLLVNGQMGKVIGEKPRDRLKLVLGLLTILMLLFGISFLLWVIFGGGSLF